MTRTREWSIHPDRSWGRFRARTVNTLLALGLIAQRCERFADRDGTDYVRMFLTITDAGTAQLAATEVRS